MFTLGSTSNFADFDWHVFMGQPARRRKISFAGEEKEEILRLAAKIIALEKNAPAGYRSMQWFLIHEIMFHVNSKYISDRIKSSSRSQIRIFPALELIQHNPNREIELGKAAAVIIATDIGSEHVKRAVPFIENDIPVFIDKPLCDNYQDLCFFRNAVAKNARICSSSSMRYCKEFIPFHNGMIREVGVPRLININMCKSWETYGIHALEAIYPIAGPGFVSIRNVGDDEHHNIIHLKHRNGFDVMIGMIYDMVFDPTITISGTQGVLQIRTADSYSSFKIQLEKFVEYLRTGILPVPFSETDELMRLVIGGIMSKKQNGREILIKELAD